MLPSFTQLLTIQLFQSQMKMEMLFLGLQQAQKVLKDQEKSTPYAAQIAADDAGAKAYEQGLRTLQFKLKDQAQEEKLHCVLYNLEDLKFFQLKIPRLCHITVLDHQKEGEYNANYI